MWVVGRGERVPFLLGWLLGALLLAGCIPKAPEQVLADAAAKMAALKSVHFTMEASVELKGAEGDTPQSPGAFSLTIPLNAQGDMVLPDKVRMALEVKLPLSIKVEMIGLGDTFYLKDPVTGRWSQAPKGDPSAGLPQDLFDPAQGFAFLKAASRDIRDGGLEFLNGVRVRQLAFDLDQEKLKDAMKDRARTRQRGVPGEFSVQKARVEVWIGDADSYLYRQKLNLVLELPLPALLGARERAQAQVELNMRFSDFDKPVEIQRPPVGGS